MPGDIVLSDVTIIDVENPVANVEVVTIGVPGIVGPAGPTGPQGAPNILSIGTVLTAASGDPAGASITGTAPAQVLNLILPQGPEGTAPTFTIGTVTTGAAGSSAEVDTVGSSPPNYTLNFTIPAGPTGPAGADGGGVATGGAVGDLLVKQSTTNFDTTWTTPTSTATNNAILKRDSSGRASVSDPSASTDIATKNYVDTQDKVIATRTSAAPTLVASDVRTAVLCSNTTGINVVLPSDTTATIPVGSWIEIGRPGTGAVTLTADTGVTVNAPEGNSTLRVQYSRVRAHKVASNTWTVSGDVTHTHTASQISDSTATGRSVLTATDAAAARTAIGAGTSSLTIGTTSSTAKAGDYQPAAANISDSTSVGRSVLTAVDAAAARTAIGAGTSSLVIGTTNTTAKAGDYQPSSANITDAASAATANVVIKRDAAGRAQVVDPSVAADISTKNYVDTQVATKAAIAGDLGGTAASPQVTSGTHHTHTSSQISDAVSINTASRVVIRDASARAQFADPSAAQDAATKNYVDTRAPKITISTTAPSSPATNDVWFDIS